MNPSKPWSPREEFPAERGQEEPAQPEPSQRSQVSAHSRVQGRRDRSLGICVKGGAAAGKYQGRSKLQRWVMEMGQAVTATAVTCSE